MQKFTPFHQYSRSSLIIFFIGWVPALYYEYLPWYILILIFGLTLVIFNVTNILEVNLINGIISIISNQKDTLDELKSIKRRLDKINRIES